MAHNAVPMRRTRTEAAMAGHGGGRASPRVLIAAGGSGGHLFSGLALTRAVGVLAGQVDAFPGRGIQEGGAAGEHGLMGELGGGLVVQAQIDGEPGQLAVQAAQAVDGDPRPVQ